MFGVHSLRRFHSFSIEKPLWCYTSNCLYLVAWKSWLDRGGTLARMLLLSCLKKQTWKLAGGVFVNFFKLFQLSTYFNFNSMAYFHFYRYNFTSQQRKGNSEQFGTFWSFLSCFLNELHNYHNIFFSFQIILCK